MDAIKSDPDSTPFKRRGFQYSLRTLLLLISGVAVWLGLYMHRVRQQQQAVAVILAAGGEVIYDDSGTLSSSSNWRLRLDTTGYNGAKSRPPRWLEDLTGRDFTSRVVAVSFRGEDLRGIRYPRNFRCPSGPKVNPWYPDPEPGQMVHLNPAILQSIRSLRNLTSLYLAETDVDDQGAECLRSFSHLRYIALGKLVSENGYRRLQEALPEADIDY